MLNIHSNGNINESQSYLVVDLRNQKQAEKRVINYSAKGGSLMSKLKINNENDRNEESTDYSTKNPFVFAYSS